MTSNSNERESSSLFKSGPGILIICLIALIASAATEVTENCTKIGMCGTPQEPTLANYCIGTACPDYLLCQAPGTSISCRQWAYWSSCAEFMCSANELGECQLWTAVPTGVGIGSNVCMNCSAP